MGNANDTVRPFYKATPGEDPGEGAHRAVIRAMAEELGRPLAEVNALYRDLLKALAANALITQYLPVFVARKVRERYRTTIT